MRRVGDSPRISAAVVSNVRSCSVSRTLRVVVSSDFLLRFVGPGDAAKRLAVLCLALAILLLRCQGNHLRWIHRLVSAKKLKVCTTCGGFCFHREETGSTVGTSRGRGLLSSARGSRMSRAADGSSDKCVSTGKECGVLAVHSSEGLDASDSP